MQANVRIGKLRIAYKQTIRLFQQIAQHAMKFDDKYVSSAGGEPIWFHVRPE